MGADDGLGTRPLLGSSGLTKPRALGVKVEAWSLFLTNE